jgi:hypothetical protein
VESFQKLASGRMHEKKNKTSGTFEEENKSGHVNGSMHEMKTKPRQHL